MNPGAPFRFIIKANKWGFVMGIRKQGIRIGARFQACRKARNECAFRRWISIRLLS